MSLQKMLSLTSPLLTIIGIAVTVVLFFLFTVGFLWALFREVIKNLVLHSTWYKVYSSSKPIEVQSVMVSLRGK